MTSAQPEIANDDDNTIYLVVERKKPGKVVPIEEQKLGYSVGRAFTEHAGRIWSSSNKITILTTEGHQGDIEQIAKSLGLQVRLKRESEPALP